jgi:transposase
MFTHVEKWEKEDIRTHKLRLFPTQNQKILLRKWMGTRRYVYNKVLNRIKVKKEKVNFYSLRNKYVTSKNNPEVLNWELETPKDIRAGAIRDLTKNYNTAFKLLKSGNIKHFKLNYCSKKKSTPSIEIPKTAIKINDNSIFLYKRYIPTKIKISKRDIKKIKLDIKYDCRLQVKNNKWYLCIPISKKITLENKNNKVCALDPGVRTFQTIYSEENVLQIKIRKENIKRLRNQIDTFKSLRARKIIKSKRLKRKQRRVSDKINNLIDEMHHKTINYLTNTYKYIILPSFDSQEISRKVKNNSVNRDLLQLKHFLFKQRLQSKCLLKKCHLDICTEEYTSKTCGVCGSLNNVGSKDIYTCSKCKLVIDRDINGARNILIKRIKELKI